MSDYETGVLVAFAISTYSVVFTIASHRSLRARNMEKVGLYYSGSLGTFTEEEPTLFKFLLYLGYTLVLTPALSWVSVASFVVLLIVRFANHSPAPDAVRVLQFRVAKMELSKEQMLDIQRQMSEFVHGRPKSAQQEPKDSAA